MKKTVSLIALIVVLILTGCAAQPSPQAEITATPQVTVTPQAEPTIEPCDLPPVAVPTPPAEVPGYTELDPATGLHMTGTVPDIDFETYRLQVTGQVDQPLSLTYDDLRCMPKVELRCTLVCPGFFQDEATWAGVPLADVLELAGVQEGAEGLRLVSADGYAKWVTMDMATTGDSFLAYEWEGEPLPIVHGFPVRAVFPEQSGGYWVKWLVQIDVVGSGPAGPPDYPDASESP
jgi:DMSO/TMAO reductase YedYZ molybdopterin-dependent catalytic subunit